MEKIMTTKTFTIAGITQHDSNPAKIRWSNDLIRRIKQFTKSHPEGRCDFIQLPNDMTKLEALEFMQTHDTFQSPDDQAIISDAMSDRSKTSGGYKVNLSLDAILERGKAQQVADNAVLESVLNAVVS
jgi:hypothetical protein